MRSVVQNNIQQRFVHLDPPVVFDKSQLTKPVHEKTDSGTGCTDHFRESLLANLRNLHLIARLTELRQQKQCPSESLFARIEKLIHQVCLYPH